MGFRTFCIFLYTVPALALCLLSIITFRRTIITENYPIDIENAYLIVQDWQTKPFVAFSVHEDDCPPETKPVFTYVWQGTELGCVLYDNSFNHGRYKSEGEGFVYANIPGDEYDCNSKWMDDEFKVDPVGPV